MTDEKVKNLVAGIVEECRKQGFTIADFENLIYELEEIKKSRCEDISKNLL